MTGSPDAAPTPARSLGADTPPKIEVGAKVRVVIEGVVASEGVCSQRRVHIKYVGHVPIDWARDSATLLPGEDRPAVSVEVLTPPAPTWQEGDLIADLDGCTYARQNGNWTPVSCRGRDVPHRLHRSDPRVPITLLVRAGKAVTP